MLQKIKKAIKKSPLITAFISITLITFLIVGYKLLNTSDNKKTVFVTIKLSQGFWWSKTVKPPFWYIQAIKVGDSQKDFLNNEVVEIISKTYYPYFDQNENTTQYNVFLTLKMQADENSKTKTLLFDRNILAVGSPMELQFPTTEISGTVVEINQQIPENKLIEKQITLINEGGYKTEIPYYYDNIPDGDTLNNGEEVVFEVLDKYTTPQYVFTSDDKGNTYTKINYDWKNIIIKAKIKVREENGQLVFGEEQKLYIEKNLNLFTNKYNYSRFKIINIEDIYPESSTKPLNK